MKKIAILAGLALALLAVIVLVPKPEERISRPSAELAGALPRLAEDDIESIEIRYQANEVTLRRGKGGWLYPDGKREWPADERAVSELLGSLSDLQVDRLAASTASKHALYEVTDTAGAQVRLLGSEGDELATFLVGKPGPDMKTSYLRKVGQPEVYVVAGNLRRLLQREPDRWRDRTFFRIDPNKVAKIEMERAGKPKTIIERDVGEAGAWRITAPEGFTIGPTTPQQADEIARQLAAMIASDLPPPEGSDADYGFDKPYGVTSVTEFDGKKFILTFGKVNERKQIFAKRSDRDLVYLLQQWMADRLLADADALEAQATVAPGP